MPSRSKGYGNKLWHSGHQFLKASPETLRFMDLIHKRCPYGKCDDQVTYNYAFHLDLKVEWDGIDNPNHAGALRINSTHVENTGLLVESVTGRSRVTNHTIKIWDRDFAWRVSCVMIALFRFCQVCEPRNSC